MINKNKKAQLKIQEMAFVLLALVLLGFIVFMFYAKFQSTNIKDSAELLKEQRALSLRDKISSLPEIKCSEKLCIDKYKAKMLQDYDVKNIFQGVAEAKILEIYPSNEEIVLFSSIKANTTYSTFINICQQKNIGGVFDYECGLGILEVGI